MFDFI
jgi:hypothetical protein